jgi:hypothetical protein
MNDLCSNQRSAGDDWRVALHEAGHVTVGRVLGQEIGGATIVPGDTFSGLTWGPTYVRSELNDSNEPVPDLCSKIAHLMPGPGESRAAVADIVANSHYRVIELLAGTAAETVLYQDDPPWDAVSDLRQARAYAKLICSETAVEAFLAFAMQEAIAIINEHRALVLAIATALAENPHRTLFGIEIDDVIARTVASEKLAIEKLRRARWAVVLASVEIHDEGA